MQDFRRLIVWEKSHQLVLLLYRSTSGLSERRCPGLAAQMRRAASSIPANIAEGCGHQGQRELARYLAIALASSFELDYHLQLATDLGVLSPTQFARLEARTQQVKRMLSSLIQRVRRNAASQGRRVPSLTSRAVTPKTEHR